MEINALNCPTCSAPVPEGIRPNVQFRCPSCGSVLVLRDPDQDNIIYCPECKAGNSWAQHHCQSCGALLQVDCPYCYEANPPDADHCLNCGANLQKTWEQRMLWMTAKQQNDDERKLAMKKAQEESHQAEIRRLVDALDEPEQHEFAIYCLLEYKAEVVEVLIETLLHDEDSDARYGSAHALGLISDRLAIAPLILALNDPQPAVRYWSATALGVMKAKEAEAALGRLRKDPHKGVRQAVETALEILEEI